MNRKEKILGTRAIVEHGKYALIPVSGRVNNSIPNLEKCNASIIGSPEMGCKFAFYEIEVEAGGGTTYDFLEEGIQTFIFCVSGKGEVYVEGEKYKITSGGYVFAPESIGVGFKNCSNNLWRLLIYKQRYEPLKKYKAHIVVNSINDIVETKGNSSSERGAVYFRSLLPDDIGFDINFHTLSFECGASHSFVETHIQQHGLYFLEGDGVYLINNVWLPVEKDDFLWFGSYTPQAFYATGKNRSTYIYTRDCNRDVKL